MSHLANKTITNLEELFQFLGQMSQTERESIGIAGATYSDDVASESMEVNVFEATTLDGDIVVVSQFVGSTDDV